MDMRIVRTAVTRCALTAMQELQAEMALTPRQYAA